MLEAKVAGKKCEMTLTPNFTQRFERAVEGGIAAAGKRATVHPSMPVSRIMTAEVTTLRAETSIEVATATMLDRGISGAPVVDENGRPTGMVSKTDLLEAWEQQDGSHKNAAGAFATPIQVGDIMVPYLLAVSHRAPISLATALMAYEGVHRLVVLGENNKMVGIVTSLDILRWVAQLSGFCLSRATRQQRI